MEALKSYLIAVVVLLVTPLTHATTPGFDCTWVESDTLHCYTPTLDEQFGTMVSLDSWPTFNKTKTQRYPDTSRIKKLLITCTNNISSIIHENTFKKLQGITVLQILGCELATLPGSFRDQLPNLRSLKIESTTNTSSLKLDDKSLPQHLEIIDLSSNEIWNLPPHVFCNLHNLLSLNLSSNRLQHIHELGISRKNSSDHPKASLLNAKMRHDSHSERHNLFSSLLSASDGIGQCSSPIEILILNNNEIVLLPQNSFPSLKHLKYLNLSRNDIRSVSDESFRGLSGLRVIDLSGNHITSLPNGTFRPTSNLRKIILSNNSITDLSADIFLGLKELQILDVSRNNLTLDVPDIFRDLRRLLILNLSRNHLRFIYPHLFRDLSSLQILDLSHNIIEGIQLDTFRNMYNLYELDLSNNRIATLSRDSLSGLAGLNSLNLHNNSLMEIDPLLLRESANLKTIILSRNKFNQIPKAMESLSFLKFIDISYNKLMTVEPFSFKGLRTLHNLNLSGNNISNLTESTFHGLSTLKTLNLSNNNITFASEKSLENIRDLQILDLSRNRLVKMLGLFAAMEHLQILHLAENKITIFDYSFLPKQLLTLDLSRNQIKELGNYFNVHSVLALQEVDVSFNRLNSLSEVSLPNSIRVINLQENNIKEIEPGTMSEKVNMTILNLRMNQISKLNPKSISPKMVASKKPATLLLGGNPLLCDCDMKWLHVASYKESYQSHTYDADYVFPTIEDASDALCTLLHRYGNSTRYSRLIDTSSEDFLCPYATHCFATCQCCDYIACDCRMKCPASCSCFHDDTWKKNLVDCSRGNLNRLPDTVPMDATVVLLDGNDLKVLHAHQFIGRHSIQKIYLNQSNIQTLQNRTFHGLASLEELYLQNNMIVKLNGFEFFGLTHLKKLYLQNNRISFLSNSTFKALKTLEILRIDNNYIVDFPVWMLADNKMLKGLTLFNNPWDCDCAFVKELKIWASSQNQLIPRSSELFCVKSDDVIQSISRPDFVCTENDDGVTHYQLGAYELHFLAGGLCGVVLLTTILIVVAMFLARRKSAKANKLEYMSSSYCNEDDGRVFDAFVCYNLNDITYIRELTDKLESRSPSFKLCLLHRDQTDNLTLVDYLVQSICFSRRIIIILSRSFVENEWQNIIIRKNLMDSLRNRENSLIFINSDGLHESDLEVDLKMLLKRSNRIKWNDRNFWKRLTDLLPRKSLYSGFPVFITDPSYKSSGTFTGISRTNDLPSSSSVLTATTGLPTPSEAGRSSILQECPILYKSASRQCQPTSPSDYIYMNHRESSRVPFDYHGSHKFPDEDSSSVHTYNSLEILGHQRSLNYNDGSSSPESHQYSLITPPKYYNTNGSSRNGDVRTLPNHLPLRTSTSSDQNIYNESISYNPYGSFSRPVEMSTEMSSTDSGSSLSYKNEDPKNHHNTLSVLKSEECFV